MEILKLLILAEVLELLGIGKTKLYADIQKGLFPPPIKIGVSSRWLASEVQELVRAYTRGATDAELVLLVNDLVARRKA